MPEQDRQALATPRGDDTVADRLETDRARLASLESQVTFQHMCSLCRIPTIRSGVSEDKIRVCVRQTNTCQGNSSVPGRTAKTVYLQAAF